MMNRSVLYSALLMMVSVAVSAAPPPKKPAPIQGGVASGGGSARGPAVGVGPAQGKSKVLLHVYGLAKEPMPKGARKSKLTAAELQKRIAAGKIKPIHKPLATPLISKFTKKSARDPRQEIARLFPERPASIQKLLQQRPAASSRLADGNIKHTIVDKKGRKRQVVLVGPERRLLSLAASKKMLGDPKNRAQLYEVMHGYAMRKAQLPPAKKAELQRLPQATALRGANLATIESNLQKLIGIVLGYAVPMNPKPANYPASCTNEEGAGTVTSVSGDMTSGSAAPTGLFAQASWPLKWSNTCVRDQGNRGTCAAFGVTAAVESKVAAKAGRWLNLSEQDLYKHDRLDWSLPDFSGVYYGDGYAPPIGLIGALFSGYRFPFERQWNYNPSDSRTDVSQPEMHYEHSCDNYTDANVGCSDANHQASLQCNEYTIPGVGVTICTAGHFSNWVCDWQEGDTCLWGHFDGSPNWVCDQSQYVGTQDTNVRTCWYETDVSGDSHVAVSNFFPLAAGPIFQPQIDVTKAMLDQQNPVILAFSDTPSFDGAPNGVVHFQPGESDRGGHVVMITGYVDNANLPGGTPAGSGGGYFIVKNSWGPNNGDGGYYYLPYDYVKTYGDELTAITDVSL